ncbi:MAG TPA: exodeoxyribonuclease VII small subunit [Dehalococcoidia bacterium]
MTGSLEQQQGETFESLYGRLEEVVRRLQDGGLTLEESVALYEEGVHLARRCQELLDAAELRITQLQESLLEPVPELLDEDEAVDGQEEPA